MLGESVQGGRDPGAALLKRDVPPGAVLVEGGADRLVGGVPVQPWRAGDRAAVDGAAGGQGPAVRSPGGVPEVEDAVFAERLRGDRQTALPGVFPGRAGLHHE